MAGSRSVGSVVLSVGGWVCNLKLYLSAKGETVSFCRINGKTKNRTKNKIVDAVTGAEVPNEELISGYEYAKDSLVFFTKEEKESIASAKRDTLDITEFVDSANIDDVVVEDTLYCKPDKGHTASYIGLCKALAAEGKVAIGTWITNGKEHLIAIKPYKHGLVLQKLFFQSEIREFDKIDEVDPGQVFPLLRLLVNQMYNKEFNHGKYSDRYITSLNKAVELKLQNKDITEVVASTTPNNNSADALKAMLMGMGVNVNDIDNVAKASGSDIVSEKPKAKRTTKKIAKG
jgi:DNA end-binding protein Ku